MSHADAMKVVHAIDNLTFSVTLALAALVLMMIVLARK